MNWIMKTGIYKIFLSLFFALLIQELKAQESPDLVQTFQDYQTRHLREKLYVHTDRDQYISGEKIWFKVYSLDESFMRPLHLSLIVYLELLDKDQGPLIQIKASLEEGRGNSYINLPVNLPSGNYTLRAYTQWMRNEDPEWYFTKTISVYNPYIASPVAVSPTKRHFTLNIFPEGGNLVNGIQSRIAFKISDQFGRGIDGSGWVKCLQNSKVFPVKTLYKGMGQFHFLPDKSLDYELIIQLPDTLLQEKLPKGFEEGYTFSIDTQDSILKVKIKSSPGITRNPVYIMAQNRGLVKTWARLTLAKDSLDFPIKKSILGEGVVDFTLFNSFGKPVSDRLVFLQTLNLLSIDAKINLSEYPKRSQVRLDINTFNPLGEPVISDLSLSVFLLDSIQKLPKENIVSYIFLRSELKGFIEEPDYYFQTHNPQALIAADLLMLTQGWRRIKWEEILKNEPNYFQFLPENNGFLIHGKISQKLTGLPAANILTSLSLPGNHFDFRPCKSDEKGNLFFPLKVFNGNFDLISQTINKIDSNYRIDLENPFSEKLGSDISEPFRFNKEISNSLLNRSISSQVQNIYYSGKLKFKPDLRILDTTNFYGIPDRSFNLDEYRRFTNMEEVIREIILDVHLKKRQGNFEFNVSNTPLVSFFDDPPLVLLDGVIVKDINQLMLLDPLKVRNIEVINRTYFIGPLLNEGIISFKTYKGDFGGFNLDPSALSQEFKGIQKNLEFYSPDYENSRNRDNRLPDFRNELYWQPNLLSQPNGKVSSQFYTSDESGRFAIVIQGRNLSGLYGYKVILFNVKK